MTSSGSLATLLVALAAGMGLALPHRPLEHEVRTFGALGDGYHDDAPALQKALDSVSGPEGGRLRISAGRYRIGRALELKGSHVTVSAEPGACVETLSKGVWGLIISGSDNVIEGLELRGVRDHWLDVLSYGLVIRRSLAQGGGADRNTVRRCFIHDFQAFQILIGEHGSANHNTIESCRIGPAGGVWSSPSNDEHAFQQAGLGSAIAVKGLAQGISPTDLRNLTVGNRLINNDLLGSVYGGIELEPRSVDTWVIGNRIRDCRDAGVEVNGFEFTKGLEASLVAQIGRTWIEGNVVETSPAYPFLGGTQAGVVLHSDHAVTIQGNRFLDLNSAVYAYCLTGRSYLRQNVTLATISANTIRGCNSGVWLSGVLGTENRAIRVVDNTFSDCRTGFRAGTNPLRDIQVRRNRFERCATACDLTSSWPIELVAQGNLFVDCPVIWRPSLAPPGVTWREGSSEPDAR